jgi:hypothetical protein
MHDERSTTMTDTTLTEVELADITAANASGKTPVVFVHGLWAAVEQLAGVARAVRGGGLRDARAQLAG